MPKNRIHKKKDGRYTYSATDSQGVAHTLCSRKGESKGEFSARCDALDDQCAQKISQDMRTMDQLFERWAEDYQATQCSAADAQVIRTIYNRHVSPVIGRMPITEITRADVYQLLSAADKRDLSVSTLDKIRQSVSRPYNWAIDQLKVNLNNPVLGLRYKRRDRVQEVEEDQIRVYTQDELERILAAAAGTKYRNIFRILQHSGLRPSEALGLQFSDVGKDSIRIRRGVTRYEISPLKSRFARREIPLTWQLSEAIFAQRQLVQLRSSWMFATSSGAPNMVALTTAWQRILKQTAIYKTGGHNGLKKVGVILPAVDGRLYDFRHTFATRMAEAGMDPKALQLIMGHSDIKITLKYYVGLTPEGKREAAECMERFA